MKLVNSSVSTQLPALSRPGGLAHLTSTASGWLVSVVLCSQDTLLVGSHLARSDPGPTCESSIRARLDMLARRLEADPSPVTAHVRQAVHAFELRLRRRPTGTRSVLSSRQLRIATGLLTSDFHRPIQTRTVAAACGVSEGHLRRAFKTCTGLSPRQYRLERRLQFCRQLLVETDHSLGQVSRQAGFVVQSHFSRVFTHASGMSPSAWRRVFQTITRAREPEPGEETK